MQLSSANQNPRSDDPVWYFLAEYSLSEFLSDHDPRNEHTIGLQFQAVRELGMPPECVKKIERILAGFAKEALVHFKQGRMEFPPRIRIFCQKKMIDDANPAKTSRLYNTEQAMEHAHIIHPSGTEMNGGWGYYLIERGINSTNAAFPERTRIVELYLYKEGEEYG